ncbi:MAG: LptA/OstA family protein [Nitrospinota bacterium]
MNETKAVYILAIALFIGLSIPCTSFSKDKEKKDPVEIQSDRMRSEDGGLKIIFSGNVEGYWGDLKITSDILEVYNTKDKKETEEIVAIGNVFIKRGDKRAKGDHAIYYDKLQKIVLKGTPKATAWQENNIIEGREMIFLLDKDRFIANDRIRVIITPKEEDEKGENKGSKK